MLPPIALPRAICCCITKTAMITKKKEKPSQITKEEDLPYFYFNLFLNNAFQGETRLLFCSNI